MTTAVPIVDSSPPSSGAPNNTEPWRHRVVGAAIPVAEEPRRGPFRDAVLYALGGGVVAIAAAASDHAIHHAAAVDALPVYLGAALAALAIVLLAGRLPGRVTLGLRVLLAVAVLVGAGLVPQLGRVAERSDDLSGHHSHAETAVIEEGARTMIAGDDPYDATFDEPGIAYWSAPIREHFPYLPAMLVLGVPRVLLDDAPVADARIVFVAVTLATLALALVLWRGPGDRKLLVFQWLLVLPTGTLIMIGGGHDLPVLALMFLSLVLLKRHNLLGAAFVLGVAAAMRQNAWVLVPFMVLASGPLRDRVRVGAVTVATAVAVTGPFAVWNPNAFVEDVVRWPLNMGEAATNAQAPTVGGLVVGQFPTGEAVVVVALLAAVLLAAVALAVARPPRSASDAALYAGIVLLGLMLMAPSGRIGYGLYPISLVVWAVVLAPSPTRAPRLGPRGSRSTLLVRPPGLEPGTN